MDSICTEDDKIDELADKLDNMLESMTPPKVIMDFLTKHGSEKAARIVHASLLSDRMFNVNFLLRLDFGYASCLVKFLSLLDPFTRTQFIWQVLKCSRQKWHDAKFFDADINRLRETARAQLSDADMANHPYTGTMSSWLMSFDDCMFDANDAVEASASIPDEYFANFDFYIKSSLWLSRIFQADFFAASSAVKQISMHENLDKVPILQSLKFVVQILNSKIDPMVKLAFWKKMNSLDFFRSRKQIHHNEAINQLYLYKKCARCRTLFEAAFQFPELYDEIYEEQNHIIVEEKEYPNGIVSAKQLIDESSNYEELALKLTLIGETLKLDDVEYMLGRGKFSLIGEMVKDDIGLVSEVLSEFDMLFLVLKYVKKSLCADCLKAFEQWKPGYIKNFRDQYGNNALWFLGHRKSAKTDCSMNDERYLEKLLVETYECNPQEENNYGLCWYKVQKILAEEHKAKQKKEEE